ncbi:MAG: hypothetical protein OEV94_07060 [Deltaproteobacteria bacterium]|nr:hypothetical protein [Deltaproteobacteria bacterium]
MVSSLRAGKKVLCRGIFLTTLLVLILPAMGWGQDIARSFNLSFDAYKPNSNELKYHGTYTLLEAKDRLQERQVYVSPEGRLVQVTDTYFNKKTMVPTWFRSENREQGFLEEATVEGNRVNFLFTTPSDPPIRQAMDWENNSFFYPNLVPIVIAHWDELKAGKPAQFSIFLVPSGKFIEMELVSQGYSVRGDGKRVLSMEMHPRFVVYRVVIESLTIHFLDEGQLTLAEYTGLSAVKAENKKHPGTHMVFSQPRYRVIQAMKEGEVHSLPLAMAPMERIPLLVFPPN